MANHEVKISVNPGTGNFTYDPTLVFVGQGDTITFSSNGQSFAVMFRGLSPADRITLDHRQPKLEIDPNAPYGVYHYAAAISLGGIVYLDSGCGDVGVGK